MLDQLTAGRIGRSWIAPVVSVAVGAVLAGAVNGAVRYAVSVPEVESVPQSAATPRASASDPAPAKERDRGEEPEAVSEARGVAVSSVSRRSEEDYIQGILARNLFDPSQIGKKQMTAAEAAEAERRAKEEASGEAETDLKITLKGTIVSRPAANSAAFIVEEGKSTAWAYGIGQKVQGAEIVEILDDRIRLHRNGRDEWLRLGAEEPEKRTASAPAGRATETSGGDDIKQVGDNEFVLDRDMVEKQLSDLESLSRMGRALLHRGPDGQYDGYRLSAIRKGSLPDQIGIRNGDIIHSINGIDMNSLEGAMQAYESLRNESRLEVNVTRRGRPEKLAYSIR